MTVPFSLALFLFVLGFILGLGSFIGLGLWLDKKKNSKAKFSEKIKED